jgi:tyrosyl-tRNA synthetase
MEAKKTLGLEIVGFYHGEAEAQSAKAEWEKRFSERQDPTDIAEADVPAGVLSSDGSLSATRLLVQMGLAKSGNEARRLIQQGALTIGPDREKITDPNMMVKVTPGLIVRVGSRNVKRVRLV